MKAIKGILTAAAVTATLAFASNAAAQTDTATLTVTATVASACSIESGTLDFGPYDPVGVNSPTGVDLIGSGTLSVTCTLAGTAVITLGQGANPDAGSTEAAPARRMLNTLSADYLSYDLYQDTTRLEIWGNTEPTGLPYTGTGEAEDVTVYGTVPLGQNVPAGSYIDTVVATITF
ncbi:fruiting body development fimbrial-like coat protein PRU [Myxococcus qinghaiensis]|uniref:fruiting body development fimbrial-like coat protein PRU n=1 Tax=Myxococcus qinghaiensis TaxID=2906758 RepID=UPI0020A6EC97|nr:fruiting body spore coat protein U [Myxococcus qinghaiensis]MCP3168259.1 fruiting body spore coat protein U [Myxococcus qinghaiensis]